MRAGDEAFEALREAIEAVAEAEVAELVAEARIEARAKVRSILAEAMAQALLDRSQSELARPLGPPAAVPTPHPEPDSPDEPAEDDAAERSAESVDALGWYVYCVVGDADLAIADSLVGVDPGREVRILPEGGLAAVASQVPLSEFGEETLRESLNDVEWLEHTARAHERVLDQVRAVTTPIPMRLCTIYRSESGVVDMLVREREPLTEALARLGGKTEWGLKLFVDPAAAERAAKEANEELATLDASLEGASAGGAYMRGKQLEGLLREETERVVEEWVEDVHSRLTSVAVEALRNPLQRPEASGHPGQMALNGVYLIDDTATDEFHACVASLSEEYEPRGCDLEATGPWPPYNFVKSSIEAAW